MPAAVGLGLVAQPASIMLGEPVREAGAQIIPWIVGAGVVNGMISYYIQRAFMLGGKTKMLPITMIAPMVLNLGLNILLLPKFGLMGAVYATVISYGFGLVLAFIVARRYFPLPVPIEAFLKTSFACAVMAGVVLALPMPQDINPFIEIGIKGSIGAAVYALVAFATDAADCRTLITTLITKLKSRKTVEA